MEEQQINQISCIKEVINEDDVKLINDLINHIIDSLLTIFNGGRKVKFMNAHKENTSLNIYSLFLFGQSLRSSNSLANYLPRSPKRKMKLMKKF